jgi:large subunit ribosomal protein LP1
MNLWSYLYFFLLSSFLPTHTHIHFFPLNDKQAEISSGQITALLEATGNTEVEAFYPIIFANLLSNPEKVAKLITTPGGSGGGGAAAGGAAGGAEEAEAEAEPEVEEEEAPMGGGDMFGGGDGGDY